MISRLINSRIDWFMGFKIEGNLLFLALVSQDSPDKQDKPVWWHTVVELQSLLSTSDRSQHRLPIDSRLDVRGGTVLLRQHVGGSGDLILSCV